MKSVVLIFALVLAGTLLLAAKGSPEFTNEQFFRFGMEIQDAEEKISNEKDWKIMYRVDTTQTADIACVYKTEVFYRLGFYQGRCYSFEKRMELPLEQVDPIYEFYKGKYGETREATRSSEQDLMYARWMFKDREIALTSDERNNNIYLITYEEVDPVAAGDARHAQEQELGNAPTEVDPITGKPKLATQTGDGGNGEAGESGEGEPQPKPEPKKPPQDDKQNPPPDGGDSDDGLG